ncbi:hypothetical protein [Haladaptatus sp. NG-WS-4]
MTNEDGYFEDEERFENTQYDVTYANGGAKNTTTEPKHSLCRLPSVSVLGVTSYHMFDATVGVLQASPLAIVPLLVLGSFVGKRLVQRDGVGYRLVRRLVTFGVIPLVFLFVLGKATGQAEVLDLARWLFEFEARLVTGSLEVIDGVLATLLEAFLGLVESVFGVSNGGTDGSSSWNPLGIVSTVGILVAIFVLHALAGGLLVWLTDGSVSATDGWLTGAGVVFFVSGLVWTFLQLDAFGVGDVGPGFAVLASSLGVSVGVGVTAFSVTPSLDADEPNRRPSPVDSDTDDRGWRSYYERLKRTVRTVPLRRR